MLIPRGMGSKMEQESFFSKLLKATKSCNLQKAPLFPKLRKEKYEMGSCLERILIS